ncbi:MAG TPA: polysaccharide biosynthesis tyrosine autokinase [Candidatus Binataceae bacterium]|nr:polysaccharide biosynthesis tyrosine autokinase [Candidatus Binataceae bacterium]
MDRSKPTSHRLPAVHEIEAEAWEIRDGANEPLLEVWRYWRTIRRHLRVVIGATLAALVLTAIHLIGARPIYTAETTIMIEPNAEQGSSTLESLIEIEAAAANSDQYYKTQCAILESRQLAADVVGELALDRNPIFLGQAADKENVLAQWWSGLFSGSQSAGVTTRAPTTIPPDAQGEPALASAPPAAVRAYLEMLKVTPVADTNLVRISFATPDAALSAQLANAHVQAYERQQLQRQGTQTETAQRFLRDKLVGIKDELQKSEAALNDYRRAKGIIPGLISLDGKDAVVLDRLADLSKDLTQAQVARIALEAQVQSIDKHDYASIPEVTQNVTIQDLQKQLDELYGEAAALASQFKPDYPPLAKLRAQIAAVELRLKAAIGEVVNGIQSQYREAAEKENELQAEMGRQRVETLNLNDAAAQYAILQREVDTNRELYNAVLTRMKDVAVQSGADQTNVSVINSAEAPTVATSPRKARDLILALVTGLSGGMALAFILEFLDSTLKNPEEAESYLKLPTLGIVPDIAQVQGKPQAYGSNALPAARAPAALPHTNDLVLAHGSYSQLGEAYRNLRTALLLSRAGGPPGTILITSATSREGKTVTAVNLSVMLAQLGGTILIDADLRRARCHRVLGLDNRAGLTEVLTGALEAAAVIAPTGIEHFDLLGAGSAPPNPTELLGSLKMAELIQDLRGRYQYIVIDSSPVLPVSDALLLAHAVDGVVVVANGATTPRQQVRAACARLGYARGKILGLVLNRVQSQTADYYGYYREDYYSIRER